MQHIEEELINTNKKNIFSPLILDNKDPFITSKNTTNHSPSIKLLSSNGKNSINNFASSNVSYGNSPKKLDFEVNRIVN